MTKKMLTMGLLASLVFMMSGIGAALAGCGPGPMVVQNKKGIILQSIGATTNATFVGTQTLAITSGTSGCSNSGIVQRERELKWFADWTLERITVDMARGGGESLDAMAGLLGCAPELYPTFSAFTRDRYARLFSTPVESAPVLLKRLRKEMGAHASLASGCGLIS